MLIYTPGGIQTFRDADFGFARSTPISTTTNTPTATWTSVPASTPTSTPTPSGTPTSTTTPTAGPSPTPTRRSHRALRRRLVRHPLQHRPSRQQRRAPPPRRPRARQAVTDADCRPRHAPPRLSLLHPGHHLPIHPYANAHRNSNEFADRAAGPFRNAYRAVTRGGGPPEGSGGSSGYTPSLFHEP